jgi:DUF4097 and DUF4098 domain-containing protein YvlB
MRLKISIYGAAIGLLIAANTSAAKLSATDRFTKEVLLDVGGTLWVDNPIGSIEITGTENPGLFATVSRTITGDDRTALAEGREQTVISFEGDRNTRFIRTIVPMGSRFASSVSYTIRVPRTIHLRVAAKLAERIRVANISGNVTVKSFAGAITLDGVTGASIIDTTNGKVTYIYHQRPAAHAQIQAVSADIEVNVPPDSNFNWVADTLRGDVLTNLPVRAQFLGSAIHGTVNAAGGPTITMQTLLGNIHLLGGGVKQRVRSLRQDVDQIEPTARMETKTLLMRPAKRIQLPVAGSNFDFAAGVADVEVGEVRGSARVQTVAGEIKLGMVYGDCSVISQGGPLDLGDIMGGLFASTEAGDIIVRSAREGGHVFTAGGIIRVLYSGGPITLQSGGGDIVMRQAAGPVSAETHSGDISITADPNQKTPRIEARTAQGNIVISLSPKFGADIDAVILTSDPDANSIHSDFTGLQIKSNQVGNKTRIHATGKLNGGGERVELYAEDGDIHISNLTASPVTIMPPLQ